MYLCRFQTSNFWIKNHQMWITWHLVLNTNQYSCGTALGSHRFLSSMQPSVKHQRVSVKRLQYLHHQTKNWLRALECVPGQYFTTQWAIFGVHTLISRHVRLNEMPVASDRAIIPEISNSEHPQQMTNLISKHGDLHCVLAINYTTICTCVEGIWIIVPPTSG